MLVPGDRATMDSYMRVKLLGKGTFGKAWKVRSCEDQQVYVAKQIKCETRQDLKDALLEADVLSQISHVHIVSYFKVIQNSPKMVTIIMEYCAGGDVGEKIARRKFRNQYFDENTIQLWTVQAAEALNYLHNRGILHRDVKPANLFLTSGATVKLGDFGIARVLDRNAIMPAERTTKTPVGTPMYFSPEMCSGKRYGQKADVWALGCVLYEMASLRPAFTAYNMDSLTAKIKRGHHDKHLPARYGHGLRKLIAKMLMVEPSHRPTVGEILHSQYLALAAMDNRRMLAEQEKGKQQQQPPQHRHAGAEPKPEHEPNVMVIGDDHVQRVQGLLAQNTPQRRLSPLRGARQRERGAGAGQPRKDRANGFVVEGRPNQLRSRESSRPPSEQAAAQAGPKHAHAQQHRPVAGQGHAGSPRMQRHDRAPVEQAGRAYVPSRLSPLGGRHHVKPTGSPLLGGGAHLRRKSDWDLVRQPPQPHPQQHAQGSYQAHLLQHQQQQQQPQQHLHPTPGARRHSIDSVPRSRSRSPASRYQFNPRQNHLAPAGGRHQLGRGGGF